MEHTKLLTKTKMSELVGWSEANGRRWVKNLKEYIPTVNSRNRVMYDSESLRVMKFLKKLNEAGLTIPEIKGILKKDGIPKNEKEQQQLIDNYKVVRGHKDYNEDLKGTIPSTGEMMIPYLELIRDGRAYSASEITEKMVKLFKLSEDQRLMKYENNSDIIFLSRVRTVRYSLKKENYIDEVNMILCQENGHIELRFSFSPTALRLLATRSS